MDRALRELAEAYMALGEQDFRARHPDAALVCKLMGSAEERSFHTELGNRVDFFDTLDADARLTPGVRRRPTLGMHPPAGTAGATEARAAPETAEAAAAPEAPAEEDDRERVFFVRKRAGGAFRERVGVGRAPNVDVSIPLPRLSKYHAYFTLPEGDAQAYLLTDAGSKNGTWVDGERLLDKESVAVADGATLRLGPYQMTFHTPDGLCALARRLASSRRGA